MSMRTLYRPKKWPFGKDVASLRRAAIGEYDRLSRYEGPALKNVPLVYILRFP